MKLEKPTEVILQSEVWPNLTLILVITTIWLFMPVLSILLWIFYSAFNPANRVLSFFMIALTFGLIAYTGKSAGEMPTDLFRYYQAHQKMTGITNIHDLLYQNVVLNGEVNILFILLSYLLAKLYPFNPQVFGLFWVTISYFFVLLMFYEFLKERSMSKGSYLFSLIVIVIAGVPFVLTVEIIKQCASVSLLGYALMLRINGRKSSWLFAICSVLIHLSGLMLIPIFLFCRSRYVYRFLLPITIITIFFSTFNINDLLNQYAGDLMGNGMKERAEAYTDYGWEISRRYYLNLAVYAVIIVFLGWVRYLKRKNGKEEAVYFERLVAAQILACVVLFLNKGNIHNFIRYLLGYYPFYILLILTLFWVEMKKKEWFYMVVGLAIFFFGLNLVLMSFRLDPATGYANTFMDNNVLQLLLSGVSDILQYNAS